MRFVPSNSTERGKRNENQDEIGFSDIADPTFVEHAGLLALVIDGMGGVEHGRESAQVAKQAFLHAYERKSPEASVQQALDEALAEATQAVARLGANHNDARSVGATLTAAVVCDDRLSWVSVGDTALYLLRGTELRRLNVAHSVQDESGPLVSSFLGLEPLQQIDRSIDPVVLNEGDRVLVCSDGVYRALTDARIGQILSGAPVDSAADALTDAAIAAERSDQDNATAAVIACVSGSGETLTPNHLSKPIFDAWPSKSGWRRRSDGRAGASRRSHLSLWFTLAFGLVLAAAALQHYFPARIDRTMAVVQSRVAKLFSSTPPLSPADELVRRAVKATTKEERCDLLGKAQHEYESSNASSEAAQHGITLTRSWQSDLLCQQHAGSPPSARTVSAASNPPALPTPATGDQNAPKGKKK